MNFQNLEYFVAASEEGNISKAAERLGISQQALSNHIARLEEELGCSLFNRKGGYTLTASGKEFLASSKQILEIKKQTQVNIDEINKNKRGELKIGVSHTRGQALLPLLIPEFSKNNPDVTLSIIEDNTKHLEECLGHGSIDLMIGFLPFMLETAKTVSLRKEHLKIAASKALLEKYLGESWEKKCSDYAKTPNLELFKNIPFVMLRKGDRIRSIADSEFSQAHITPSVYLETENIQTAFSLAAEGIGITIISDIYLDNQYIISGDPDSPLRKKVIILPFTAPGSTIAIGYNSEKYQTGIAKEFIRLAKEKLALT